MIAKEYRSSVMDTVVRRGADVGSDHYLVETRLKLKLKRNPREMKGRTRLESGKAAGHNSEVLELLKTDLEERTKELTKLFNKVKEEGVEPKSWSRGLIVKLPKKGNLHECTNWRGITLLPVISKIFGRVLISRIKKGVDNILGKELSKQGFERTEVPSIRFLLSGIYWSR